MGPLKTNVLVLELFIEFCKFKSNNGSRSERGSIITNHSKTNPTEQEKKLLADAMSHTVSTADGYYAYHKINDSVASSVSIINKCRKNSEVNETFDTTESESLLDFNDTSIPSSAVDDDPIEPQ